MRKCLARFVTFIILSQTLAKPSKDPYKLLDVSRDASSTEIKQAFKRLAVQFHPDKVKDGSPETGERYIRIQEAYAILSDEERRSEFDKLNAIKGDRSVLDDLASFFKMPWKQESRESTVTLLTRSQILREVLGSNKPWIIQVSASSVSSRFLSMQWEKVAVALGSDVQIGRLVASQDPHMASDLLQAARSLLLGFQLQSHNSLPAVLGFPPGSQKLSDAAEYVGSVSAPPVAEFVGTKLLGLPKVPSIRYHRMDVWVEQRVLAGTVAFVLSSEDPAASLSARIESHSLGRSMDVRYGLCSVLSQTLQIKQALRERFGVRSYPAALAFTDMGQDPFVYKLTGEQALNFSQIAAMHRWPLVPPLQVDTVEPLGCSWGPGVNYKHLAQACAVLAGTNEEGLRKARQTLSKFASQLSSKRSQATRGSAAEKFRQSALRLSWLNAGNSLDFIRFHNEASRFKDKLAECSADDPLRCVHQSRALARPIELIVYQPGAAILSDYHRVPHRFAIYNGNVSSAQHGQMAKWLSDFLDTSSQGSVSVQDWPPQLLKNAVAAKLVRKLATIWKTIESHSLRALQTVKDYWHGRIKGKLVWTSTVNGVIWPLLVWMYFKQRPPRRILWLLASLAVTVVANLYNQQAEMLDRAWRRYLPLYLD